MKCRICFNQDRLVVYEVKEMMVALGYEAEENYLTGLLELFGARSSASANSDRFRRCCDKGLC